MGKISVAVQNPNGRTVWVRYNADDKNQTENAMAAINDIRNGVQSEDAKAWLHKLKSRAKKD